MIAIFKQHHGMNIVGQGGKIILFMLPSLAAALLVHVWFPTSPHYLTVSALSSPWDM